MFKNTHGQFTNANWRKELLIIWLSKFISLILLET